MARCLSLCGTLPARLIASGTVLATTAGNGSRGRLVGLFAPCGGLFLVGNPGCHIPYLRPPPTTLRKARESAREVRERILAPRLAADESWYTFGWKYQGARVCLSHFVICRDSGSAMPRGISIPILPTFGIVGEVGCEHVKDVSSTHAMAAAFFCVFALRLPPGPESVRFPITPGPIRTRRQVSCTAFWSTSI